MNILFINSAKEWGGNEKWSLAAAEGLARKGHKVFFGCRASTFREHARGAGVVFVRFPLANNYDVLSLADIAVFLCRQSIDIMVPTKQREYFLGGFAAWLLRRVKVVARLGIDRSLHNWRNRFAFKNLFDGVIVNAESIVRTLGQTMGFDVSLCRVVRNGVAVPELIAATRARKRKELGLQERDVCIMGIGRLAPQKGFDYAITAFARLAKKNPLVKLVIVGGGDGSVYREQAYTAGVGNSVIFTGFRDDVTELIQAADICWLTSRSEGVPNTMLEAMAAKIPVAAFDIAGVPEVLKNGENGFLIKFEDIDGLAAATERLIEDPALRQQIGESGFRTVVNEFSMEKMISETEKYLKEFIPSA
jgi:glycosyltransferase involved in cell wall biosynthesis